MQNSEPDAFIDNFYEYLKKINVSASEKSSQKLRGWREPFQTHSTRTALP